MRNSTAAAIVIARFGCDIVGVWSMESSLKKQDVALLQRARKFKKVQAKKLVKSNKS